MKKLLFRPWVNASVVILLLRIILGVVFIAHGAQKVLGAFGGKGLNATTGMFTGMGIPPVLAYMDAFGEFIFGILVLLGLITRVASAGIAVIMLVAIIRVHLPNGFFAPAGFEFPLTLLTIATAIFLYGSGRYGIDYFWERKSREKGVDFS
ncbi:MAG TPA: DoxX family protein [Ignavibacteriales bacterium]|nr:DoxX family protein [Ignavibacteriales bacterium]